jgi:hypothetical protein
MHFHVESGRERGGGEVSAEMLELRLTTSYMKENKGDEWEARASM